MSRNACRCHGRPRLVDGQSDETTERRPRGARGQSAHPALWTTARPSTRTSARSSVRPRAARRRPGSRWRRTCSTRRRSTWQRSTTTSSIRAYQGPEALALVRERHARAAGPTLWPSSMCACRPAGTASRPSTSCGGWIPSCRWSSAPPTPTTAGRRSVRRLAPTDSLLILRKPFDAVEIRQLAHTLTTKWSLRQQTRRHLLDLRGEVKRPLARAGQHHRAAEARSARSASASRPSCGWPRSWRRWGWWPRHRPRDQHPGSVRGRERGAAAPGLLQPAPRSTTSSARCWSAWHRGDPAGHRRRRRRALSLPVIERDIGEALDGMLEGTNRITTILRAMKEFMHPVRRDKAPADLNHALLNTLTVASSEYKYVARVETELAARPAPRHLPHRRPQPGVPQPDRQRRPGHRRRGRQQPHQGVIRVRTCQRRRRRS